MKKNDLNNMLENMDLPDPVNIKHHKELKIPLLSYKKSSWLGIWFIIIPIIMVITLILRRELNIHIPLLSDIQNFFDIIDNNQYLTYLIPIIFVLLPLVSIIINLTAICHFVYNKESKELLLTIKYRLLNILLIVFSFIILLFFLLPDSLSF